MSAVVGFSPSMQWSQPNGQLTPDAQRLLQAIIASNNGEGAGVTVDSIQTLINKSIDGNSNTLTNIDTDSLKTRTGDDEHLVTGTAGTAGFIAVWDASGNLIGGSIDPAFLATSDQLLLLDGTQAMGAPLPLVSYTVATVPTASDWPNSLIYVSDESGGAVPAFSDGTDWLRVTDRAVIS